MKTCPVLIIFPVSHNFYQKHILHIQEKDIHSTEATVLHEAIVYIIMMYFNTILSHKNPKKNTIMDTILQNIKDLRNEFSVSEFCVDGELSNTGHNTMERMDNIDSIRALQKRYHQHLAETSNSKENMALSSASEENCSYYTSETDTRNTHQEYSSNWLSKFYQKHRESQDSGHSSPDDSRSPSPNSSYSRICKSQSPTPVSSDDGIDIGIEELVIEEENRILRGKSPVADNEWKMVASKPKNGPKTPGVTPYCPDRALCSKGNKCKERHTQKEKELFEARKTAKTANDKEFSDTKFRTELCNKVNVPHNRKMCRFAHGVEQLVCKTCSEVGHKKEICPKEKEKEKLNVSGPLTGQ